MSAKGSAERCSIASSIPSPPTPMSGNPHDERGGPSRPGSPMARASIRPRRRSLCACRGASAHCPIPFCPSGGRRDRFGRRGGSAAVAVGAYKAKQTTSPMLRSALELMAIGLVSALAAWGIGKLFGVTTG
jgi:hypothetical protein